MLRKSIPEILNIVASESNRAKQRELLLEHDSQPLREILKACYHPDIRFDLPKGSPPYKPLDLPKGYIPNNLFHAWKKFYIFQKELRPEINKVRREHLFIQMLEGMHPEEAEIMIQVKDKEMTYKGITQRLVHDTWPDLVPMPKPRKSKSEKTPEYEE